MDCGLCVKTPRQRGLYTHHCNRWGCAALDSQRPSTHTYNNGPRTTNAGAWTREGRPASSRAVHTHTHTHTHARTHARTHEHTHTHTRARTRVRPWPPFVPAMGSAAAAERRAAPSLPTATAMQPRQRWDARMHASYGQTTARQHALQLLRDWWCNTSGRATTHSLANAPSPATANPDQPACTPHTHTHTSTHT
jgi:hypothetical protein